MYETFYNLVRRPFSATPDPDCCAGVPTMQNAFNELYDCLETREGIAILTATAGLGKTLLCRKLLSDLSGSFATVFLANSNFSSRRSLLQALLYELGHSYARMGDQELRLELTTAVHQVAEKRGAIVLAIDEAHLLSNELLEEIRCITNLASGSVQLVRVLLSGQLLLEERLTAPALEALNQRIRAHATLEPLSQQESVDFIEFRLNWAGAELNNVIDPEAVQLIVQAADGIPRCLNQLCDHSLTLGAAAEQKPISVATVQDALDDLKQLPLHWNQLATTRLAVADDDNEAIVASRHVEPSLERDAQCPPDPRIQSTTDRYPGTDQWQQSRQSAASSNSQIDEPGETSVFEIGAGDEASVVARAGSQRSSAAIENSSSAGRGTVDNVVSPVPGARSPVVVAVSNHVRAAEPALRSMSAPAAIVQEEYVIEHVVEVIVEDDAAVDEELIIDNYAALDARHAERKPVIVKHCTSNASGKSASALSESAPTVRMRHRDVPDVPEPDRKHIRQPRPDLTIDDVVPLLETILDVTCGKGNEPRPVTREIAVVCPDDDVPESMEGRAGSGVADSCLENEKPLTTRDARRDERITQQQRHGHRARAAEPLDSDVPVEGYDVILPPEDYAAGSAGGAGVLRPGIFNESAASARGAKTAPTSSDSEGGAAVRPYERLFSDLRRRQQRA